MFGDSTYQHEDDEEENNDRELEPATSNIEQTRTSGSRSNSHFSRHDAIARAMDAAKPTMPLPKETPPESPPAVLSDESSPAAPSIPVALTTQLAPAPSPAAPTQEVKEKSPPSLEQLSPWRETSPPKEQMSQQQLFPWRERAVELPERMSRKPFYV